MNKRQKEIDKQSQWSGEIDGYKWEVNLEESMAGWLCYYYYVIAPDGEFIEDDFFEDSSPEILQDAIDTCEFKIKEHQKKSKNEHRSHKAGKYKGLFFHLLPRSERGDL